MDCSVPGFPVLHHLPESAKTHIHWDSDAIHPSHPLSSPSPPAFNLSQHQALFQWVSSSHQVARYWSFSFSISPSNEYSGLISFRIDRFDLLAVQGTLKSLLQHHSLKASILWYPAFFLVQLSHPYINTGKTIALTRWAVVGKVMSHPTTSPILSFGQMAWTHLIPKTANHSAKESNPSLSPYTYKPQGAGVVMQLAPFRSD